MKIFVAGATGAVGSRLVPLLVEQGHEVVGMTRSRGDLVRGLGWRLRYPSWREGFATGL